MPGYDHGVIQAQSCAVNPLHSNATRDEEYIYYFRMTEKGVELYRKKLPTSSSEYDPASPGEPVSTGNMDPTLPADQWGTVMLNGEYLYWGRTYPRVTAGAIVVIENVRIYRMKRDGSEPPELVGKVTGETAPVKKMQVYTYLKQGDRFTVKTNALAFLLDDGKFFQVDLSASGTTANIIFDSIADFAIDDPGPLLGQSGRKTIIYMAKNGGGPTNNGKSSHMTPRPACAPSIYGARSQRHVLALAVQKSGLGPTIWFHEAKPQPVGQFENYAEHEIWRRRSNDDYGLFVEGQVDGNLVPAGSLLFYLSGDRIRVVDAEFPPVSLNPEDAALDINRYGFGAVVLRATILRTAKRFRILQSNNLQRWSPMETANNGWTTRPPDGWESPTGWHVPHEGHAQRYWRMEWE